ncbi:hypothetical protein CR513_16898, partial [Mucuna pruriens]
MEALEDQSGLRFALLLSWSTRFPLLLIERTPEVSLRGVSRLATHTTVCSEILLYHIPTYRFVEFRGLKKPSAKFPRSLETKTSPSFIGWFRVMLASSEERSISRRNGIRISLSSKSQQGPKKQPRLCKKI